MNTAAADIAELAWQATLELGFTRRGGHTVLSRRHHRGPLQVQRPYYPEHNGTCHVYILHPPGGVVGGDVLHIDADLDADTAALLTTPAAGKFYRSAGPMARQEQTLHVAHGAALEWLPQENIVFQGARATMTTRVELNGNALFMGWEILCLGRPAADEGFQHGECQQRFEIRRDGRPLYLEHSRFSGGSRLLEGAWGMHRQPVTGSLVCTVQRPDLVAAIREATTMQQPTERFAVSQLADVLICRYLGASTERARDLFCRTWRVLRPAVSGRIACAPRIWNT